MGAGQSQILEDIEKTSNCLSLALLAAEESALTTLASLPSSTTSPSPSALLDAHARLQSQQQRFSG